MIADFGCCKIPFVLTRLGWVGTLVKFAWKYACDSSAARYHGVIAMNRVPCERSTAAQFISSARPLRLSSSSRAFKRGRTCEEPVPLNATSSEFPSLAGPFDKPCSSSHAGRYLLFRGCRTKVQLLSSFLQVSQVASSRSMRHWIFRDRHKSHGRCFFERYLRPFPAGRGCVFWFIGFKCELS